MTSANSIVSLLLTGREVENGVIKSSWPVITKEFNLINIYVDNYNEYERLAFIEKEVAKQISFDEKYL
mgnify:CR=1 FL=1